MRPPTLLGQRAHRSSASANCSEANCSSILPLWRWPPASSKAAQSSNWASDLYRTVYCDALRHGHIPPGDSPSLDLRGEDTEFSWLGDRPRPYSISQSRLLSVVFPMIPPPVFSKFRLVVIAFGIDIKYRSRFKNMWSVIGQISNCRPAGSNSYLFSKRLLIAKQLVQATVPGLFRGNSVHSFPSLPIASCVARDDHYPRATCRFLPALG